MAYLFSNSSIHFLTHALTQVRQLFTTCLDVHGIPKRFFFEQLSFFSKPRDDRWVLLISPRGLGPRSRSIDFVLEPVALKLRRKRKSSKKSTK